MSQRNRSYRERQRNGIGCYLLELPSVELAEALQASGFLTMPDPSHDDVSAALTRAVLRLIEVENEIPS